jgi:sigma-B regulation protein RsbU (phosphoserine phosphatase)
MRVRLAYFALAVLFAISISHRVREIRDRAELLFDGESHVRNPFDPGDTITEVATLEPEAQEAGLARGDVIVAIGDRPYRGLVDFYAPIRGARPGDRLRVQVRSRDGVLKTAPIELKPFRAGPRSNSELPGQIVGNLMPLLCILLGFWVAAVRVRDLRAWIFLGMMISFAELNSGFLRTMFGHDDFFQPIGAVYQWVTANVWAAGMMLFGIYFPERWDIDRRWPWLKWLLLAPIFLGAAEAATGIALAGRHAAVANPLTGLLPGGNLLTILHLSAVACFFVSLAHKSLTTTNRDARRRLLLLSAGAAISITPLFLLIIINIVLGRPALQRSTAFTVAAFLIIIGFPLTMAYVIVVERAMDARVVIRQGLQYLLASKGVLVLQSLLIVVVVIAAASLSAEDRGLWQPAWLLLGAVAVFLIRKFALRLRTWIDRRFFREAYDAEQILSDLANKVRTIVETKPLLETVANRISQSLHVPRVAVLLNGGGGELETAYALGYSGTPEQLDKELVLPLSVNQKDLGVLVLGPKRSEEPYSQADVRLLSFVATQTGLALENSRLTAAVAAEVAQRERLNREIEIAREVQERLFPQDLPEIHGLDYAGHCRPASGVGGDYYDFLSLPDGKLGIAIGDVSGKGIPAALLMAGLRASLRGQTIQGAGDLAVLMANVNQLVYESSSSNRYATFFYAQYDPATRHLTYVNAGHNPPLILRKSRDVMRLETGGPVVGLLRMFAYEQATVRLEPGDMFIAFTDGISEAMNSANEEWGEQPLIESAWRCYTGNAEEAMRTLIASADAFVAGASQHDDMTIIVARVL